MLLQKFCYDFFVCGEEVQISQNPVAGDKMAKTLVVMMIFG